MSKSVNTLKFRFILLSLFFLIGLFFRTFQLGAIGFSEDEANKILAVRSYQHGDFLANGEHPMLMKWMAWTVVVFAERNSWLGITPEAAVRFPVALAGSLLVFAIYFLGRELFTPGVALIASALWAVDTNGIALSRIAKEDPLATLFFVLGNFFLLRGKRLHFTQPDQARPSYIASGASFGMMFASKYIVPFPWVTLIYYDLFRFRKEPRWRLPLNTCIKLYGAFLVAFVVFNPIIFDPAIWEYLWKHFTHGRLTHHGYFMMDQLFINKAYFTFWGVPFWYYALYILVKTPLPLLFFLTVGLVYALRNSREERLLFISLYFIIWLFLLSLPGGKFTRYVVTLLPAVVLLQALGIFLFFTAAKSFAEKRNWRIVPALSVFMAGVSVGWYVVVNFQYHPYYSFYVAAQGGGESKWGYYFPQDDFYDAGLREAISYISRSAPAGTKVIGCTPAAFRYYQEVYGRSDLKFQSMADKDFRLNSTQTYYVIGQNYRRYLENEYLLVFFASQLKPQHISFVKGLPSVMVYVLAPGSDFIRAPYWRARRWPGALAPLSGLSLQL